MASSEICSKDNTDNTSDTEESTNLDSISCSISQNDCDEDSLQCSFFALRDFENNSCTVDEDVLNEKCAEDCKAVVSDNIESLASVSSLEEALDSLSTGCCEVKNVFVNEISVQSDSSLNCSKNVDFIKFSNSSLSDTHTSSLNANQLDLDQGQSAALNDSQNKIHCDKDLFCDSSTNSCIDCDSSSDLLLEHDDPHSYGSEGCESQGNTEICISEQLLRDPCNVTNVNLDSESNSNELQNDVLNMKECVKLVTDKQCTNLTHEISSQVDLDEQIKPEFEEIFVLESVEENSVQPLNNHSLITNKESDLSCDFNSSKESSIKLDEENNIVSESFDSTKVENDNCLQSEDYDSTEDEFCDKNDVSRAVRDQSIKQSLSSSLPAISEGSCLEDIDLVFNLQNSPMLRSRVNDIEGRVKRDCRFLFNDEISASDSEETSESDDEKFKSIRDSIDIAKHLLSEEEANDLKKFPVTYLTDSAESLDQASSYLSKLSYGKKSSKYRDKNSQRRVSFPEDENNLITSYLEPVNPWFYMGNVCTSEISKSYISSCRKHSTESLPTVLQQITALPLSIGVRVECLSMKNIKLDAKQCECLEELFRRVQFQTLDFENCELDDESSIPLFDMIEFYDSAVNLNISSNTKIGTRGWQACGKMIKRAESLKMLEARNINLSEASMPVFCKSLRMGSHLQILHLENCNLSSRTLCSLTGALRFNDSITDLYLGDNGIGGNDCIPLGNLIKASRTLKVLDLRNNNIQDTGCGHICKDIVDHQVNPTLNSITNTIESPHKSGLSLLNLWNNHITVQSVPYISLMLSANQTIQTLNLGRNNVTTQGLLILKNSLIKNKTLVRLGLQATRICNEGAVALAECIADNQVLSRIDLRENKIQVAGLMAIKMSLKVNEAVVQLDLDSNPKSEPNQELSEQHLSICREIKSLCQNNQTRVHLIEDNCTNNVSKNNDQEKSTKSKSEQRKISLTCETIFKPFKETIPESCAALENRKYWSPEPSPSISPCPSPSVSPSFSPVPSPLKNNRFKVCKVAEDKAASLSPTLMHRSESMESYNLPYSNSLPTSRPNRFSGGRFTVTKVTEPSFNSSLSSSRTMSSPSLIASQVEGNDAPTIVVSSPNKAVRGFSVENDPESSTTVNIPTRNTSLSSESDCSLQDDVFIASDILPPTPPKSPGDIQPKSLMQIEKICDTQSEMNQKAPLATLEGTSFDSDSEDSELATQSSDSTHSEEIRISSMQMAPKKAWSAESTNSSTDKD